MKRESIDNLVNQSIILSQRIQNLIKEQKKFNKKLKRGVRKFGRLRLSTSFQS